MHRDLMKGVVCGSLEERSCHTRPLLSEVVLLCGRHVHRKLQLPCPLLGKRGRQDNMSHGLILYGRDHQAHRRQKLLRNAFAAQWKMIACNLRL